MLQPKKDNFRLNQADQEILEKEMIAYAEEGASDDDLIEFKNTYVAEKKKATPKSELASTPQKSGSGTPTGSSGGKGFPKIDTNSVAPGLGVQPKVSVAKKTFRLPTVNDEVEMQRRGITPPPSEILKQTANNTKDLYDLDANGNVIPEKPNKLFAGLKKQDKTKGFYQQGEELVKQNKDIQNGFSEKTTFELEGGKLIPKTTVKDFKTSEGIDKEIENNDLNLDHPYLYYSTFDKENQPKDTFVESNFGENKLADLGINPADFDGFLNKIKTIGGTSYKAEYLDKEAKGLFEGKGTDLTGGYNIQLAKEIQKQRLLNLYMQDINSRDFAKRKLNQEKVNLGKLGADREQLNTQYTLFDSNKVGAFYEKEMPILTQKLKERDAENKKIYDTHKNGDAGFFYGTKQVLNSGWNGFLDRVNQTSSTMLDKIGLDSGADELRLLNEERQVQRPNTRDVGYASGRTTTYDGVDYLVTNDGQIIDKDKKIRVTDLFFKPTYDAIVNKSKSGEEDSVFSFQGSAIQAGGVLGDMIVQVALQRGVGLASGATVKSGSLLSKIPISKSIGSAIIAQSALGYSQGLEQTYKAAIDAGIDEKMAKVLATDAAQRMAGLYAVTAPISPQTKAIEGIFGSEGKELIKKAIAAYTQTGKKGFIETFKQGGKQLSKNAIIFTEEGGKEVFQENIQQGGENYGVNASINRDAGTELLKENISGDEFVNTSILSFASGGLMTLPGMFSSTDKLKTLQQLSKDPLAFEKNLKELVSKGVFTNDKADVLRKDVKIYSNQAHKIPKNLNKDIAMDVMSDLEDISQLELKKKGIDKSFHEEIDAEIEAKRTGIRDRINFVGLSKKEIATLKETASDELIAEAKEQGKKEFKFDNKQITERANKIYAKQVKENKKKENEQTPPTPEAKPQAEVPQQAEAEKVAEVSTVEDVVATSVAKEPKIVVHATVDGRGFALNHSEGIESKDIIEPKDARGSISNEDQIELNKGNSVVQIENTDKNGDKEISIVAPMTDFAGRSGSSVYEFTIDKNSKANAEGINEVITKIHKFSENTGKELIDETVKAVKDYLKQNEATPETNTPTNGNVQLGASNVGESGNAKPKSNSKSSVPSSVDGGEVKGDASVGENNNSWDKEFQRAKSENDLKALDVLYDKVKVMLNGIAQKKGEETVRYFQNLKNEIKNYSVELKKTVETLQPKSKGDVEVSDFAEFEKVVNESKTADEAFDKIKNIKGVSSETSKSFREKYDPKGDLSIKEAFGKFYDEVKAKTVETAQGDTNVPLSNIGKQIEPHNEVNTDVETVKKELKFNDIENLIYDEFKDVPKTDDDISKKLEKVNDSFYDKVDDIEKKINDIDLKIEDNNEAIDKVNDDENLSAAKKKKAIAVLEKEFKDLQKQQKDLESEKEDVEALHKDLSDTLHDWDSADHLSTVNGIIDRVNNRLETRKSIKEGTNLFPEDANIPEFVAIKKELIKLTDEKTIADFNSRTAEQVKESEPIIADIKSKAKNAERISKEELEKGIADAEKLITEAKNGAEELERLSTDDIKDLEYKSKNNTTQVPEGKGSWRKAFNEEKDAFKKSAILRRVAEKTTSKSDLLDIKEASKGMPEESNILNEVNNKLKSIKPTTKERIAERIKLSDAKVDDIKAHIKGIDNIFGIKIKIDDVEGLNKNGIDFVDVIASIAKQAIAAGIHIDEAINKTIEHLKGKYDFDVNIDEIKERINPKKEAEKNSKDLLSKMTDVPNSGEIGKYISRDNIETSDTEEDFTTNQDYDKLKLIDSLIYGKEIVEQAKADFGDNYIEELIKNINEIKNVDSKTLHIVSLENDLRQRRKETTDVQEKEFLTEQINRLQPISQKLANTVSRALNLNKLRQLSESGVNPNDKSNSIYTKEELETKHEIGKSFGKDINDIQEQYEEVEKSINDFFEDEDFVSEDFELKTPAKRRDSAEVKKDISDTIKAMRKALLDVAKGNSAMSSIPYAKQFAVATPFIAKLTTQLAELGIINGKKAIDYIHKEINKVFPGIKKSDIASVIKQSNVSKKQNLTEEEVFQRKIDQKIRQAEKALQDHKNKKPKFALGANSVWSEELSAIKTELSSLRNENSDAKKKAREVKNKAIDLLINSGYGKEINVTKKEVDADGNVTKVKSTKKILDWKKLAGESGSVANISKAIEKALTDQNLSKKEVGEMVAEMKTAIEEIKTSITEKSLTDLQNRNKIPKTVNVKTEAKNLSELYNQGIFDDNMDKYDIALNRILGFNKFKESQYQDLKDYSRLLSNLFSNQNIFGDTNEFMSEDALKTQIAHINKQINEIVNKASMGNGRKGIRGVTPQKIVSLIRDYSDMALLAKLLSLKQAVQNPISGYTERLYQKIGSIFDEIKLTPELKKQLDKGAWNVFKDITVSGSPDLGDSSFSDIRSRKIDDKIRGIKMGEKAGKVRDAVAPIVSGTAYLNGADAYNKVKILESVFAKAMIDILSNKNYGRNNTMTVKEATIFVSEALTGESFNQALIKAEQIIKDTNNEAGKDILPSTDANIYRLAMDVVRDNLTTTGIVDAETVKAVFAGSFKAAGSSLGHESNNPISTIYKNSSQFLDRKIKESVKEKNWGNFSLYVSVNLAKNITMPFVSGRFNWAFLGAQITGANLGLSTVVTTYQKNKNKIDFSTEEGRSLKNLTESVHRKIRHDQTIKRSVVGLSLNVLVISALAASGGDDELEKFLEKSPTIKKVFKWIFPMIVLYFASQKGGKEEAYNFLLDFYSITGDRDRGSATKELGVLLDDNATDKQTANAKGRLGKTVGKAFDTPIPWRLGKDIKNIENEINGKEQYVPNYNATSFLSGALQGGFFEAIGMREILSGHEEEKYIPKEDRPKKSSNPGVPNFGRMKINP